ncbi:hypothetical protein C8Q77DRAFT_153698 [Trametes polyzona]|nr:hypothetical protein C8Q77DRAFT_153698 [Trametes polyzona]
MPLGFPPQLTVGTALLPLSVMQGSHLRLPDPLLPLLRVACGPLSSPVTASRARRSHLSHACGHVAQHARRTPLPRYLFLRGSRNASSRAEACLEERWTWTSGWLGACLHCEGIKLQPFLPGLACSGPTPSPARACGGSRCRRCCRSDVQPVVSTHTIAAERAASALPGDLSKGDIPHGSRGAVTNAFEAALAVRSQDELHESSAARADGPHVRRTELTSLFRHVHDAP